MKLAFCSDIHLDSVSEHDRKLFYKELEESDSDVIVIAGDISESHVLEHHMHELYLAVDKPVYYVNGNHDYYYDHIDNVFALSEKITDKHENIFWLQSSGVIELTKKTCICGHDGFYDCGFGDYDKTLFQLWDFTLVRDFAGMNKYALKHAFERLSNVCADHIRKVIPGAMEKYEEVIFVTHVPPFEALSKYKGKPSEPEALPFFCSKIIGEALKEVAEENRGCKLTILCGHTHDPAKMTYDNIHGVCAAAEYGRPAIHEIMEVL